MRKKRINLVKYNRQLAVIKLLVLVVLILLALTFFVKDIAVFFRLEKEVSYGPDDIVNGCGILNVEDTNYFLSNEVESPDTCFKIYAKNIVFDCQGFKINHSALSRGYGVYVNAANVTVKNCIINNTNTNMTYTAGIFFDKADSGSIFNNTIYASADIQYYMSTADRPQGYGWYNHGILLSNSLNVNIFNNYINSIAGDGFGIYLNSSSHNSIISNNTIKTYAPRARGIYLLATDNATVRYNDILTTSYVADGMYMSDSDNNNISSNIIKVTSYNMYGEYGISLYYSKQNVLTNNLFQTDWMPAIFVAGNSPNQFNHTIPESNLEYGKPIKYYFSENGTVFENENWSNYGQVIFASSSNITIRNLSIDNDGLNLYAVTGSIIEGNSIYARTGYPLFIYGATDNDVIRNNYINSSDQISRFTISGKVSFLNNTFDKQAWYNSVSGSFSEDNNYLGGLRLDGDNNYFHRNLFGNSQTAQGFIEYSDWSNNIFNNSIFMGSIAFYYNPLGGGCRPENSSFIYNSKIIGVSYDIYVGNGVTEDCSVNLVNTTINYNKISYVNRSLGATVNSFWYADIFVNDSYDDAVGNASINSSSAYGLKNLSSLTDNNGFSRQELLEYSRNSSASFYFSNWTISASSPFLGERNVSVNMNTNRRIFIILGDITPPDIGFMEPTPPNNSLLRDFFIVNVSANDSENNVSTFIDFDDSLIAWYRMDDVNPQGEVVDYLGRINASRMGQAKKLNRGVVGNAFSFDGNGDYIDLGNNEIFNLDTNFSISFWFKSNTYPTWILAKRENVKFGGWGFRTMTGIGRLVFNYDNSSGAGGELISTKSVIDNEWHFASVVINRGNMNASLYLDGEFSTADYSQNGNTSVDLSNNLNLVLGASSSLNSFFNGSIDDVMIFNRVLSEEEILALYAGSTYTNLIRSFTGIPDGTHSMAAYTQDIIGNINKTMQRIIYTDSTPPIFTLIRNISITNQSAMIFWQTNEYANGTVEYGLTTDLGMSIFHSSILINHVLAMNNLEANKTYFYNVTGCDASGNCGISLIYNFRTLAEFIDKDPPLVILASPENSSAIYSNDAIFSFVPYDISIISNCTLYLGGREYEKFNIVNGTKNDFSIFVENGDYIWNVSCIDKYGNAGFSENWFLIIDYQPTSQTSGGGGGGGGIAKPKCKENWTCESWNVCRSLEESIESSILKGDEYRRISERCRIDTFGVYCGFQTRSCWDVSSCNITLGKPEEMTHCYYVENPSCSDGVKDCHDGDCELLVDCGGPCNACPTCSDGIKNQDEEGIDCGGPCPACLNEGKRTGLSAFVFWGLIGIIVIVIFIVFMLVRKIMLARAIINMSKITAG